MVGVIRKRDIIAHPLVTVRCFGWRVFVRSLFARRGLTFLALVAECGLVARARSDSGRVVDRAIELEARAGRIYARLAGRFSSDARARDAFERLARDEGEHAELLELSRAAARSSRAPASLERWDDALSKLEGALAEAESASESVESVEGALRLAIDIETSELNSAFRAALAESGSEFVEALEPFRSAVGRHLEFLRRRAVEIAPSLEPFARSLGG